MTEFVDYVPPSLVQAGWSIYSRDGEFLGEVLGADSDRFLLPRPEGDGERLELAAELLMEEEPAEMRARIALAEDEVDEHHDRIERIPRTETE